jgi:uncharacterized phage protein (TIGR02220 family)
MPSPVRIDAEVWTDWRFECLANACGFNRFEAVGRMAQLWSSASDREVKVLPVAAVRAFLGPNGPEAIVDAELGEVVEGGIRLRGSHRFDGLWEDRRRRRERASAGGQARAAEAERDSRGRLVASATASQQPASQQPAADQPLTSPSPGQASLPGSGSSSVFSSESPLTPPSGGTRPARRKRADPTHSERAQALEVLAALSKHSAVQYRGSEHHVALIARQLRAGRTELDLRKVAWYCAKKIGKSGWRDDPEMRDYLRPETLFGPTSIERYLDAARTAYFREYGTDDDIKAKPALAVVEGGR